MSSSAKISGNTLWPAFAADCLSAWIEGLSPAFSHKGSLVHDEISAEKKKTTTISIPFRRDTSWKGAGMNFLRVLVDIILD